jgi:L-alanine-DL-glutamate epimerase-like enolase superfamily enzyme
MTILQTEIYRLSIPMHPFTIATGTMHYAQNILIRVHTDAGYYGVGECSAFPMIVGETQATCFEMAKDFARIWKDKDALDLQTRMAELHDFTAFNTTIKSAFDMALHDLAAKAANQPLYRFLGGTKRAIETDLTIGIDTPEKMAEKAIKFKTDGARMIKIKLGKGASEDVGRVRLIRAAVGDDIILRIDANQGWDFDSARTALRLMGDSNVQFCEQPMRHWDDHRLPELRQSSPVKIMADESVFNHHDALRLIEAEACDYVNIKFAKSSGILGATAIDTVCAEHDIPCMMGGMLESRVALTAFMHFALAHDNIIFHDMDTCMLGHTADPVTGGVRYNGYFLEISDAPGLGADADDDFLDECESITV